MSEVSALERVWAHREESIYPKLFGPISRGTFVLDASLFQNGFRQKDIDPRWLRYGIIEYAPTDSRSSWIYVSSGASNPWDSNSEAYDSSGYSGMGAELVLEVPNQANWAILVLRKMLAFNILLTHGRLGDSPALDYGDKIPLKAPVNIKGESLIQNLLVSKPQHYPSSFKLESGQVDLLHLIGITDNELSYAKANSSSDLLDKLLAAGFAQVTDPERPELQGLSPS